MSRAKHLLTPLAISLLSLLLPPCSQASMPLIVPITKDSSTSLYTVHLKNNTSLVLDLAGPLVWSTCPAAHRTFPCRYSICAVANRGRLPSCPGGGSGGNGSQCVCTVHPYNPVTEQCAPGDLTLTQLSAAATDGKGLLDPVSFSPVAACAPADLLGSLPAAVVGVAGMGRSPLALPAQVAASQKVERKFALCLTQGGNGFAVLGGGPVHLAGRFYVPDITTVLSHTPLLKNPKDSAYYLNVTGIAIESTLVALPPHALDHGRHGGAGGVALSTRAQYTAMRPDIYRPFVAAYGEAMAGVARAVAPVAPFGLCFDIHTIPPLYWALYAVPPLNVILGGGATWTWYGGNSIVKVNNQTACLAFVEMDAMTAGAGGAAPAMVIGALQMENYFLQFDMEKGELGLSRLLSTMRNSCGGSYDF